MNDDGCDVIGKGLAPCVCGPCVWLSSFFFLCVLSDNSFRLWVWVRCVKWLLWRVRWSRGVLCCFRRNLLLSIWKRRADYVVVDCIAFAMMFRRCRFTHQLYDWNKCLSSCLLFFFFPRVIFTLSNCVNYFCDQELNKVWCMQAFLSLPPFCACGIIFLLSCVKNLESFFVFLLFYLFFSPSPFPRFLFRFRKIVSASRSVCVSLGQRVMQES